jgi:DNA-directed RNA polymerase subunit RPC12/RpoP
MSMIENETVTRAGTCTQHGRVTGEKELPKIKFPFLVTAPARALARTRGYRCPQCGAKVR